MPSVVVPSFQVIVPVGVPLLAVTLAVKVTLEVTSAGDPEDVSVTLVDLGSTTVCVRFGDSDGAMPVVGPIVPK